MLTIIEVAARADGGHGLQSQSHRTECWLEGWIAVPPELEQTVWDCRGYCELTIHRRGAHRRHPGHAPGPAGAGAQRHGGAEYAFGGE